jgi:NADPH:quinone reductase-like Zn-dependent oxidoreductase
MKAMIYTKAGGLDMLQIRDIPIPVPTDDQVLVKVKASSLNILDYDRFKNLNSHVTLMHRMSNLAQGSIGKPLGGEVAGIVSKTGKNIQHLEIGDEVYGKTLGQFPSGGWAEYAILDKSNIHQKPSILSFEESAVLPVAGETALGAVRKGKVKHGQQVMIYGSSGGVGQYAVQFTKAVGATVTGVCSTRNVEMAYSIGCDYVINYKREDYRKSGRTYDVIIGINGKNPLGEYKRLLNKAGFFVAVGGGFIPPALLSAAFSKQITFYGAPLMPVKDYLAYITELAEEGKIRPFIDKVYPVQNVAEAIRYVLTEHAQGKVALTVDF